MAAILAFLMDYVVTSFFVIGLLIGSFLNVVIHRVPRGMSIVHPPSRCPHCESLIRPRDNVPVIGWLLLRGRCRKCQAQISARYPIVEILTALLFAFSALRFAQLETAIYVSVGLAVLLCISVIDLDFKIVPNVIVLPALGATILCNAVWSLLNQNASPAVGSLFGALGVGGIVFLVALLARGGLGMGDVKLAAYIGAFAGHFSLLLAFFSLWLGVVVGGIIGVLLLVTRRAARKQVVPYAPMLAFGVLLALLIGDSPVRAFLGF